MGERECMTGYLGGCDMLGLVIGPEGRFMAMGPF